MAGGEWAGRRGSSVLLLRGRNTNENGDTNGYARLTDRRSRKEERNTTTLIACVFPRRELLEKLSRDI